MQIPAVPITRGLWTRPGQPIINWQHKLARGLLWDGVDIGHQVLQLVPGRFIAPNFNITSVTGDATPHTGTPYQMTPWGPAMLWPGYAADLNGVVEQGFFLGYGVIGWLDCDPSNNPILTDPIRVATGLQGAPVGTGWTAACTYRQVGIGGTGEPAGPWIFGRFNGAGEESPPTPIAFWAFVQSGSTNQGVGGGGSGTSTVAFHYNSNGSDGYLDWTTNYPPLGSLVSVAATAQVVSGGTATIHYYGSINYSNPILIGTATGLTLPGGSGSNNEDQIGWGGIFHYQAGLLTSCHWGNTFRGSFRNTVWSMNDFAEYASNPDGYHLWPQDFIFSELVGTMDQQVPGGGVGIGLRSYSSGWQW